MIRPPFPAPSRRGLLAGAFCAGLPVRALRAADRPERIASLGGAVTEILWRLGAAERVVIVDTTSVHPPDALREKPNAGYLRALSAEGLIAAGPDLVIAAEGAGPPPVLAQIREAGIRVESVVEPPTAEGVLDKITAIGRLAGLEAPAEALRRDVAAGFAGLETRRAKLARRQRGLVVLSQANGRVMVGGRESTADGILALAGLHNAAGDLTGFKPITDEAIVAAAPDAIVMMANDAHVVQVETVFAPGSALGQTPAAATRSLVAMDGLALLGFGPRTPETAAALMRAVYPDLPLD